MTKKKKDAHQDRSAPEVSPKVIPKKRTCLRCDKTFMSEWIGNRMCPPCLRSSNFLHRVRDKGEE